MCVICQFPKGFEVSFEKVKNAVLNNPDGFGIVTLDRGKIDVLRECKPTGNDPDRIQKFLEDTKDVDRFLHVRKNTVGKTNMENTHPFQVYKGTERQIEFMHNGTLYRWKPSSTLSDDSDTRNFAENYLHPLLNHFYGEKGIGDFTDPFFKKLVEQEFTTPNVGLLIGNGDLGILELGSWKEIVDGHPDHKFRASNDSYFDKVYSARSSNPANSGGSTSQQSMFRGSQQETTEKVEKKDGAEKVTNSIYALRDVNRNKVLGRSLRREDVESLTGYAIDNFEDLDDETFRYFAYLTKAEIQSWTDANTKNAGLLLELMFMKFSELLDEYEALDEQRMKAINKHEAATKRIADLTVENERLKEELANSLKRRRTTKAKKELESDVAA